MGKDPLKKILLLVALFIFLVGSLLGVLRLVVGGGEDSWICVQGKWVKHGVPSGPPPETGCGEESPQELSLEKSKQIAQDFVQNAPSYKFDGFGLKFESSQTLRCPSCWQFNFAFQSRQAGYGDRTGQVLAQVITPHEIKVVVEEGRVTHVVIDGKYDELNQKFLE